MTVLRRKLNSMFCNKVNFIFTRELSYSCCGNHHFAPLDFGAFKFSTTGLHIVAYFVWTLNLLHTMAWLPWTWKSCQSLVWQPSSFPSLPDTLVPMTLYREIAKKLQWFPFYLENVCFGEVTFLKSTVNEKHRFSGNVNWSRQMPLHLFGAKILIQGYFWICAVLFSTHGVTSESSQVLACVINHASMRGYTAGLTGAPEMLNNISQGHIKPKHL